MGGSGGSPARLPPQGHRLKPTDLDLAALLAGDRPAEVIDAGACVVDIGQSPLIKQQ